MDNEENMNAVPASEAAPNEENHECCCENGVCSFEPAAETAAPETPAAEACECADTKVPCCEESAEAAPEASEDAGPAEAAEKEEKAERPVIPVTEEMLDDVRKKLATMLDFLGLDATVKAEAGNSKINLIVASEDAGRIIGRKGQSLENLQLLVNRMVQKNDVNYPRIYIDIDGYSSGTKRAPGAAAAEQGDRPERRERRSNDRRGERHGDRRNDRRGGERHERRERRSDDGDFDSHDENLRMLALDSAKEVRMWGDSKTLPEMNAHDRRIIHLTLEKEADLITDSIGEEPHKAVVISLKK